jgi:PAS domain S-box-containing protein
MNSEKVNILMVDDRSENLLALEAVLSSSGYHLVSANSGEEALKFILKYNFAVILLDVQMPGMNGFETARLIKAREKSKHTPIIFITAISQATEHVVRGYSVGAIDYIFKPFHPDSLKLKIEEFVRLHKYNEQVKQQGDLLRRRTAELELLNDKLRDTTAELRKAEALARIIAETSLDTMMNLDDQGRIVTVNPAVKRMFGFSDAEVIGEHILRLLPELNHDGNAAAGFTLPSVSYEGSHQLVETAALRKDGSRFFVDVQFGEADVDHQRIYVCTIRDITERKQLELERDRQYVQMEKMVEDRTKELQLANHRIESILESITDGFYAMDNEWRITYVNVEAEKNMKKHRGELIGSCFWESFPNVSPETVDNFHKVKAERVPVHFELLSKITGEWHEFRAYPSEQGISVYFSNITKRKEMEQDLRRSEQRFRKIFDSSPSLIAIKSLEDSRYLDVNESWLNYMGYTYKEVKHRASDDLFRYHMEWEELTDGPGSLPREKPVRNMKIHYWTRTGQVREGLLSTEIIQINHEKCMLIVVTDITDRVLLEQEMARLDRLNLIGEMAAGIAHEIRNPMTTVRGFLQISKSSPSQEYIDLMIDELDRANAIITEFLTLAKNKSTDRQSKYLHSIIDSLFPLIQAEAVLFGKNIKKEIGVCPALFLDEKEIRQLILNLALNGLEAMDPGGELTIKTYVDKRHAVLEIADQGSGIEEEWLPKIGTPFFTTKEQGTGLGLAVCYSVASRHNAVIELETGEAGTTFYVRFGLND